MSLEFTECLKSSSVPNYLCIIHDWNGKKVDMMENLHEFYNKYERSFVLLRRRYSDVTWS